MKLGTNTRFYCGRNLGEEVIPDSDGVCGPHNGIHAILSHPCRLFSLPCTCICLSGPQCPDCAGFIVAHPHALTLFSSWRWRCDGCSRRYGEAHPRFRCEKDDFDYCPKCVLLCSQSLSIKQHRHPVAPVKDSSVWMCKICKKEPAAHVPRFRCTKNCGFEACGTCLQCALRMDTGVRIIHIVLGSVPQVCWYDRTKRRTGSFPTPPRSRLQRARPLCKATTSTSAQPPSPRMAPS